MNNQHQRGQKSPINHRQIAALLSRSAEQLDEDVVSSLRQARAVALQKQRAHAPVFSLSTIGHRAHNLIPHTAHQWLAATVVLAAIVFGMADYWQSTQDKQNLDIAILTDDLPIDVFVDK